MNKIRLRAGRSSSTKFEMNSFCSAFASVGATEKGELHHSL
jgi:hypothetical protein